MKVLVVGGGRDLYFLAQAFRSKGHSVTVIDRDKQECSRLARRLDALIIHGDGSDESILEEAGARSADIVLAATERDADNLITCQISRSRFAVPRAVALVNDPENQRVFMELGIDAISPSLTVASLIEQRAALDQVTNLILAGEGKVTISEVVLGKSFQGADIPIAELLLPRDALIAVVMRDGETIVPRGETRLAPGDRVLLVTLSESRDEALGILTGQRV